MLRTRKLIAPVTIAAVAWMFTGCSGPAAPEPKTYKVDTVRVQGDTTYVQVRVTKTKIKVSFTCKQAEEIACGSLHKGNVITAISEGGKLTKVKVVS